MFAGSLLLCGYKSTLLSTLIPIYYEGTVETLIDVSNSDLPLTVPKNTAVHWLIGTDPRSAAKPIRGKLVLFPFNGLPPPWVNKRLFYARYKLFNAVLNNNVFRIKEGSAIGVVNTLEKAREINEMHFSKENLASVPSGYILPRGSPLQVI